MDCHRCGDCNKEFYSFEAFLIHKLLIEKYKLTIEPSKRVPCLRIPKFVKPQVLTVKKSNFINSDDLTEPSINDANSAPGNDSVKAATNPSSCSKIAAIKDITPQKFHLDMKEKMIKVKSLLDSTVNREIEASLALDVGNRDVCLDSDDSVSVSSQTESLRIDESATAKDNQSSPLPDSHQELETTGKTDDLICCYCNRCYKNKVILRVHKETVHEGKRHYSCGTCKQNFKTKGSLVRHVRIHTGERPFHCSECKRAFHDSGTLCRHINRLHRKLPGQKPSSGLQVVITQLFSYEDSKSQLLQLKNS